MRHSFVSPSRREAPPSIWDTHGLSGNVFANPLASSSAPYPRELNQWSAAIEEPLHTSTAEESGRPERGLLKTEVCTCSQFPTEAMQWIKEVELVDSVDELRSSSSTHVISMPDFEVLDARISSALNKIIHDSHFKRRISLEEQKALKKDCFLRGRQIAYLIYDQFRVSGTHDSVENYTDLFTVVLRNDDIQEFDSKWDGIFIVCGENPA